MMAGDGGQQQPEDMEVGEHNNEEEAMVALVNPTEDLQIAWENLDLARSIVARLADGFDEHLHTRDDTSTPIVLKSNASSCSNNNGNDNGNNDNDNDNNNDG